MLLFARCNDDRTAQCNNQWHKYAKVEYGKYAEDRLYIAKGMYVAKGKYIEYKDVVYVAECEYGKYTKGGRIRQGGPQQASFQRWQQQTPCQGW